MKPGYYWALFMDAWVIVLVLDTGYGRREVQSMATEETREFPGIYTDYRGPIEEPDA